MKAIGIVGVAAALALSGCAGKAYGPPMSDQAAVGAPAGKAGGGQARKRRPKPQAERKKLPGAEKAVACEPEKMKPLELFLSADDSNSQASPVVARDLIRDGRMVPTLSVRTYEYLNYYDVAYLDDKSISKVIAVPQLRPVEGRKDAWTLQIGVQAPPMAPGSRRPLNLTLVLDTSGSMAGESFENMRHTVRAVAANLVEGDKVTVVAWGRAAKVLLAEHAISGPKDAALGTLVNALRPDGRTDLHLGLKTAYGAARANFDAAALNRVVLISDGNTNTGQQVLDLIAREADNAESKGIYLVGVAVGSAHGLDDTLMDKVTDKGKGAYVYIDSPEEAQKIFGEGFDAMLEIGALDVRVKLTLPPGFEVEAFHGEQISTVAAEVEPQHLAPGDAMVYHQVIRTCAPDKVGGAEVIGVEAAYTDPSSGERRTAKASASLSELMGQGARQLIKGKALVTYAEALKKIGVQHRTNRVEALGTCQKALEEISAAVEETKDTDLNEVEALMTTYCGTVATGEVHKNACDCGEGATLAGALGVCEGVGGVEVDGASSAEAIEQLAQSGDTMAPREGCRMLALSTGKIGEAVVSPGATFSAASDPAPAYMGDKRIEPDGAAINDLTTVEMWLTAPASARSFSFDFLYLSAEYPNYIGSQFNDTFYAIIEAESTNNGAPTNVSFDPGGKAIEINNNYFENDFHPCFEEGSGFDGHHGGSTCWLRTHWAIKGGERFKMTFTIHDEGDAIYSSAVLLDNFKWHGFEAVGATDPVN